MKRRRKRSDGAFIIANRVALERFHGASARLALGALESAVRSADPAVLVRKAVRLQGKTLCLRDVRGNRRRISGFGRVYVVGAGKAAAGMAESLHSILGERIAGGAITVPRGSRAPRRVGPIAVSQASHPIPDRSAVEGTEKMVRVLQAAKSPDLVVALISGGGSSLMALPARGVSLADKQRITGLLLGSGASIHEINTVRKHLSAVKGGQLLRHVAGREGKRRRGGRALAAGAATATVVSLIISDVVGDDLGVVASGPTHPDESTFKDALAVLQRYGIVKAAGRSDPAVKRIIDGARGELDETPKPHDRIFWGVHNVLVGSNASACQGAARYLERRGVSAAYLGSAFDGPAGEFGRFMARLASDLAAPPHASPLALVAGGETTVRLERMGMKKKDSNDGSSDNDGKEKGAGMVGGRNQEAALTFALERHAIRGDNGGQSEIVAAFMGTDGIDGNSDAAGGLVSSRTVALAIEKGIDLRRYLAHHDSYHALLQLDSLIFTGPTGTNVNDIAIAVVGGRRARQPPPLPLPLTLPNTNQRHYCCRR